MTYQFQGIDLVRMLPMPVCPVQDLRLVQLLHELTRRQRISVSQRSSALQSVQAQVTELRFLEASMAIDPAHSQSSKSSFSSLNPILVAGSRLDSGIAAMWLLFQSSPSKFTLKMAVREINKQSKVSQQTELHTKH